MEHKVKILVVEDEMIIAAKISMQLTSLGYEVTGILPRGDVFSSIYAYSFCRNQPN
jgi:DNA-binding response OmpR family regulator